MRAWGKRTIDRARTLRLPVACAAVLTLLVGVMAPAAADSDSGLYAAYHLDEGAGTVLADSSGNARFGAITNGVWTEDAVQGLALDFSGDRTEPIWASFPGVFPFHDPGSGGSADATLSFWVKPVDDNHRTLLWTREGVNTPDANRFHIYTGGVFTSPPPGHAILGVDYRSANDEAFVVVFEESIALGEWTKVVMTRTLDASTYTYVLYLDGVLTATYDHPSGDLPDSTTWSIGRMDNFFSFEGFWFNGQLDEIQLWNRALTPEEVVEGPLQWRVENGGNGHWYRLSPRPVDGLDDAIQLAAETPWLGQPGYVVSVLSEGEKDFLVETFGSETLYLIGYTDREAEGVWRWVSGEPSGYEFWASGEPNNFNDEDLAVMNWQHEVQPEPQPPGAWNDLGGWNGYAIFEYEALTVSIDIKPGSYPNSLNIDGHGVIPVAVLGSESFDVTQIDTATLDFAGLEVKTNKKGKVQCSFEDVSGDFTSPEGAPDGNLDLVCQFIDDPARWNPDNGTATLRGQLLPEFGGAVFWGSDVYRLVPEARCTDPLGCAEYGPGDPIVIGAALALTGGLSDLGLGELRGTQLALLQRGELFGRPLAVLAEDAQCSPDGGAAAATALVGDPAVVSVVGTTCSNSAVQAAPIITAAGYSMVSPSNTSPALTDPGIHEAGYLRVAYNDLIHAEAMGEYARAQLDASTAAIIRQDDPYGRALASQFAETFTTLGGVVLTEEVLDTSNPDIEAAVANVAAAGPPDLVYLLAFEPEGSQTVIAIRNQPDLDDSLIASSDAVIFEGFLTEAGPAAEGVYATAVAPPSGPAYDGFIAAYENEFGEPPTSGFDAYAFDGTNMILNAVDDVGTEHGPTLLVGRQQLRDALFATAALEGVTGAITCNPYGDCAAPQEVQLWQVQGGEFAPFLP